MTIISHDVPWQAINNGVRTHVATAVYRDVPRVIHHIKCKRCTLDPATKWHPIMLTI